MLINLKMWACQRFKKEVLCAFCWDDYTFFLHDSQWKRIWNTCHLEAPGTKNKMRITKLITLSETRQKYLRFDI